MISWLKKHFVPHDKNENRPHLLRNYSIRGIVVTVLCLELIVFLIPTLARINTTGQMAAVLPAVLSMLTNEERESQDLPTLTVSPVLNEAAKMKAEDMATKGYFAHISPEGKTPWYWLAQVGYDYIYAGENLAIDFSDSKDVTSAWMESPTHKANIVKEEYTEVGTGIARGIYEGRETVFVAQVYANPFNRPAAPLSPTTSASASGTNQPSSSSTLPASEGTAVLGAEATAKPIVKPEPPTTTTAPAPKTKPPVRTVATTTPAVKPVPKTESDLKVATPTDKPVAATATKPVLQEPTFLQKLLASPRNTMNVFLFVVFAVISIALFMYVFSKIRIYQLDLITNGLIALSIVGAIFIANHNLSYKNMVVIQSLDYSNESR